MLVESKKLPTFAKPKALSPGGGMVDALVSGASVERRAGSSPVSGTSCKGEEEGVTFRGGNRVYAQVVKLVYTLL